MMENNDEKKVNIWETQSAQKYDFRKDLENLEFVEEKRVGKEL
ncbi:hypothetical protein [Lentilactobacillus otakiensis]|uniref:Uncharacterized protein n=1 Tax=Lentilactobacillus otakiensis DSM 19908 = JCM 15040 TaxID=1423780 RepID=S4NEH8_9LACO|nr:hypothetical protein [Lentilactobacillus otakiensis]GAD17339.1 hypothetical protein LOT_1877 [Lentilactobacillus otakiensis DSM 19908 = JCM 15040]